MFKKILLGALFALVATSANAQFEAGKKYFNLSTSSLSLSYSKNDKVSSLPTTGCYMFKASTTTSV